MYKSTSCINLWCCDLESEICRASQQPGCLSRVSMWHPGGRNFFLMGTQFFLLRPSDNWIRPKHTIQATGSDGQETICNAGDPGSIPASGRTPGERNCSPLQYPSWRIPWIEEPDGPQSMGWQRVGHSWVTNTSFLFSQKINRWQWFMILKTHNFLVLLPFPVFLF